MEGSSNNSNSNQINPGEHRSGEVIIPNVPEARESEPLSPPPSAPFESEIASPPPVTSDPATVLPPSSPKFPKRALIIAGIVLLVIILGLGGAVLYQSRKTQSNQNLETQTTNFPSTESESNTITPTVSVPQIKTYSNQKFGLSFNYPTTWLGPDIYEHENGVRLEVGTDTVYPYGTDILSRAPSKANSYFVTIQYTKGPTTQTKEEYLTGSPWLMQLMPVIELNEGEEIFDARSKTTKVRNVSNSGFTGAEYISTLSETAQTEITYSRNIILVNDNYDTIRIMGIPAGVIIPEGSTWQIEYQKLDEQYLHDFRSIFDSLKLTLPSSS